MRADTRPSGLQMAIWFWVPAAMGALVPRLRFGLAKARLGRAPGKPLASDQPSGLAASCVGVRFPFLVGAAAVAIWFALREWRRPGWSASGALWLIAALPVDAVVKGAIVLLGPWFGIVQTAWGRALLDGSLTVPGVVAGLVGCANLAGLLAGLLGGPCRSCCSSARPGLGNRHPHRGRT